MDQEGTEVLTHSIFCNIELYDEKNDDYLMTPNLTLCIFCHDSSHAMPPLQLLLSDIVDFQEPSFENLDLYQNKIHFLWQEYGR